MRILRIDPQGCLNGTVFKNKEHMRLALCDYHSIDWQEGLEETDPNYIDIFSLTFDEICNHGEWDYKYITNKEALDYEDNRSDEPISSW